MSKIIVRKFGGEDIGEITQSPEGEILITAYLADIRSELEVLVKSITEQPLIVYSGKEIETDQGTIHETIAKECVPGDSNYLYALTDALLSSNHRIHGKRIRGIFIEN